MPLVARAIDRLPRIRVDRDPTVEKCVGECDPADGCSRGGHDSECGRRDQDHDQPLAAVAAERHAPFYPSGEAEATRVAVEETQP